MRFTFKLLEMRKIENISEVHQILLNTSKEFSRLCKDNGIPYYMLGGTMLGAIRHKGFIPWDDDMDFGVPRPYYDKLVPILERDLPYPYRCCTYKNSPGMFAAILKIEDSRTAAYDPRVKLPLDKQIGLSIDIFPLDYCKADNEILKKIYRMLLIYQTVYVGNSSGSIWKNAVKSILSTLWPVSRTSMLDNIHQKLSEMKEGPMLANVFGAWHKKECIPVEWYGENTIYSFEDTEFCGIRDYDKYLTQLYGDYMTPLKGDRLIHLSRIFWKDI